MGIIHTARKYIREELIRKMYIEILEERKRKNINATLSLRDDAEVNILNLLYSYYLKLICIIKYIFVLKEMIIVKF